MASIKEEEMKSLLYRLLVLVLAFLLIGCGSLTFLQPTPTPTSPSTHTPTSTVTASSTPTSTLTSTATLAPTATATSRPSPTATPTEIPKVTSCAGAPDIVLQIEDWAMVSKEPPVPNKVRSQPGSSGEEIGMIPPGETMLVEDGPRCADGYAWWYVHSFNGLEGWTAEGDASNYWLIPLRPISSKWDSSPNSVTLTADQVHGASNIEAAINNVTDHGSRPGTVILDGQEGPFVYTLDDRSLNIFVSNLTLVGINEAVIKECDDGLFFDFDLENILVEGIEFNCEGHGVWTDNAITNVVLRNNIFRTGLAPLSLNGHPSDWLITLNLLEAPGDGIQISGAKNIKIVNNHITNRGGTGITLQGSSDVQMRKNILHAAYDGIKLFQGATRNLIERNTLLGISHWGIFLASDIVGNQVLHNTVICKRDTGCPTVYAPDEAATMNTIEGNRP
jgi:parallel beta-helix repeat protein